MEDQFPLVGGRILLSRSPKSQAYERLRGPDGARWQKAMEAELANMAEHHVWDLVPRAEANKVMTGLWVFREKETGPKARWCARGFNEPFADDTYADVLPAATMRLLFAFAASKRYHLRHVDVTAAFLHAPLDVPIYVEQPHAMEVPGNLVCRLNRAIYGLRTAPRRWQEKLKSCLLNVGFSPFKYDPNVYRRGDELIST